MPVGSANPFPSVLLVEGSTPASPTSGDDRLFVDSADHVLKWVNSSGVVTPVTPNVMTAVGDLMYGGTSGAATRLAAVATGKVLASQGVTTAPAWGYLPYHGCRAYNSATESLAAAATTAVTFDTNRYDTDSLHSTSSNTSRITIPTALAGKWRFGAHVRFTMTATGRLLIPQLRLNGTTVVAAQGFIFSSASSVTDAFVSLVTEYVMAANDYMEVAIYNEHATLASTLQVSGNYSPEFWATMVGV